MIRKSIIVFLTLCFAGVACLWLVSHITKFNWQLGDPDLESNRSALTLSFDSGRMVIESRWRDAWITRDGGRSLCYFSSGEYQPPNKPIPGVRYGIVKMEINGRASSRRERNVLTSEDTQALGLGTNGWTHNWTTLVFTQDQSTRTQLFVWISLWLPILLFSIYPSIAFIRGPLRRHSRRKRNQCIDCGYNLTGNVSGVCPECGLES